MGVLVIRKTSIFAQYSKAATVQSFSDLAAGWGLPPARTRRVSSIGAGLAPLSAPVNRLGASRHVKCVAAAKQRLHSRCLECPLDCGRLVGSCSASIRLWLRVNGSTPSIGFTRDENTRQYSATSNVTERFFERRLPETQLANAFEKSLKLGTCISLDLIDHAG